MLRANPREIGPIPPVADPGRKAEALASFRFFLESYFRSVCCLDWSDPQRHCIEQVQDVVAAGKRSAGAEMPRMSGKTTLCERAALWAVLRGSDPMVDLVAATDRQADAMRRSILDELEHNAALAADFPEVCTPIRRLEGVLHRRLVFDGQPVLMRLTGSTIVLPSLPANPAAGSVIRMTGLHGGLQGASHRRPDGRVVRSTLVIIDDPPISDSLRRNAQTRLRVQLLTDMVRSAPVEREGYNPNVILAGR